MIFINSLRKRVFRNFSLVVFLIAGGLLVVQNISGQSRTPQAVDPVLMEAEQRLADLGYWILKIDGIRDASTYHAVIAFQKAENYPRTGELTSELLSAIRTEQRPRSRLSGSAHIEIDISRQILFLVADDGVVTQIPPVPREAKKNISAKESGKSRTRRAEIFRSPARSKACAVRRLATSITRIISRTALRFTAARLSRLNRQVTAA